MRIIVLDKNFDTIGSVGIFNSLIWDRRYYESGIFELHTPVEYFELLNSGKYIYRNDRKELGVIREVSYQQTDKGERAAYVKGYFAEHLLDDRVIQNTVNITGTPEDISRALMTTYFLTPSDSGRKIENISLGDRKGIGTSTTLQTTGDNVGAKMYEIEQTQEMSHRLSFDYLTNTLTFEVWKGLDRTDSQDTNSWAIFSNSFYNVKSVVYDRDESASKNYAYVAGEGEDPNRIIIEIDARTSPDEERREVYVDARDLQSKYQDADGTEHTYSADEYKSILRQRGIEKLSEYAAVETINSDIDADANLVYRKDFDLGDLCTYKNTDVGIECAKRITEIQEVYEGSSVTLTVTFGVDDATSITKIIKRETT